MPVSGISSGGSGGSGGGGGGSQSQSNQMSWFGFSPLGKTLISAITEIQEYAIMEKNSEAPAEYLTIEGQTRLFGIGFHAGLESVVKSLFLVPISVYIFLSPSNLSASVKVFALMLMLLFPLGTSLFLSTLPKYILWKKGITNIAINRMMAGLHIGGIVVALVVFVGLYTLMNVMLYYYPVWKADHAFMPAIPYYLTWIPLPTAWIIMALHIFFPLVPLTFITLKRRKIRRSGKS